MKRWMTPLATIAGTAVMLACAHGQEAPIPAQGATTPTTDKQAKKPATDKKQKVSADKKQAPSDKTKKEDDKSSDASDDAEAKPLYNSLDLAYTTWTSTRNINAIHQNGYLQGGFGIADLSLLTPYDHDHFYSFDFKGDPGNDYGTRLIGQWGSSTSLDLSASTFSFFNPTVGTLSPSQDKAWKATIEHQIAPNFGAFASYQYEESQHAFPAPLVQQNFNNGTLALGTQKQMGGSTLGMTFTENRFSDLTQTQPNSQTDRGELRYLGNWGSRLSTEATLATSIIQQQGLADSFIRDYSVSGVYDVTDGSALGAHWSEQILDLSSVQNAYVRKKLSTGGNLNFQLGQWGAALGFDHREEERVRSDHSYVDVPEWNEWDFKLNGRLAKTYRVSLKSSVVDLTSAPVFLTSDPTLLYWSRQENVEAKVNTGNEVASSYLSYTYRYRQNDERGLSINWYNFALGGSYVFSPKLLGYAEFASDQYQAGGPSPEESSLLSYFPSSETYMFGLDYTRNSRENLSLVLTSFYTQDEWGQQVALTYRLDFGKERNFQITYSPWLQRDRLYDVDTFDAPILQVKVGTRF